MLTFVVASLFLLAQAEEPFRLLALGDSITFGCGAVNSCCNPPDSKCSDTCCAGKAPSDTNIPPRPGCQENKTCPWTPCPTCKGGNGTASFRTPLLHLLDDWHPQKFEFVGSMKGGGTRHMGFPGWRIDQIYNISSEWSSYKPDAILLLIGTNDVMQGPNAYAPAPYPTDLFPQMYCNGYGKNGTVPTPWKCHVETLAKRLDILLAKIFELLPNTQLFLSQITGLPKVNICYYWPNGETDQEHLGKEYNIFLPGLVKKYKEKGNAIFLVDMLEETHVGKDGRDACPCGIHPNDLGYELMSQAWFKSLRENLELPSKLGRRKEPGPILFSDFKGNTYGSWCTHNGTAKTVADFRDFLDNLNL